MEINHDTLLQLKTKMTMLYEQEKQTQLATNFASLLKLIEMGIYPQEILERYPHLLETFANQMGLPKPLIK